MSDLTRLGSLEELDGWLERSRREPVWVFKHSLTCPTSASALEEYRAFVDEALVGEDSAAGTGFALIEVQNSREVSTELARRTGVRHESPQALLLRDGEVVWHASHWRIRVDNLRQSAAAAV